MGTRGLYGFILNGIYYLMYVHYDGDMLMSVMKREAYVILKHYGSIKNVKKVFEEIKWRTCGLNPTKKEIELLEPWTNLEVENRTTKSWYCLLHYCQKSLIHTLESGYILLHDNKVFLLFMSYSYIQLRHQRNPWVNPRRSSNPRNRASLSRAWMRPPCTTKENRPFRYI